MTKLTSNQFAAACVCFATLGLGAADAAADSVAQIQTAKRISRQTVVLIDPQGRPGVVPANTDTTVQAGDILTFVIQFTPVPNGATRGLGGYITDYIPRNTEVVGARIVDKDGNTVPPHRGGFGPDGLGPRGKDNFINNLPQGSMSQLYADTGIFYSTSLLTVREPAGDIAGEEFISVFNGLEMNPRPTAAGQLDGRLGTGNIVYAHNKWDLAQVYGFGSGGAISGTGGNGVTPHLYGSPVAGPDTWYPYEATFTGMATDIPDMTNVTLNDTVGPWQRIQTAGAEIGRSGEIPDMNGDMPDPGIPTRVGIPALDGMGAPLGWQLSPGNPLPSYDKANPTQPYTTAVRFAVGELVVGEEYFAEISLRVLDTPLDPVVGMDVNCAEVFGGDASSRSDSGNDGGKDNAWRYFLPAPQCVVLNNFFELSVDRLSALSGERLTYTVEGKNLSTMTQTGVVVRQCFESGTFVSATGGGMLDNSGTGCPNGDPSVVWMIGVLMPGESYLFTTEFDAQGQNDTDLHRGVYISDALPLPGFQVLALTTVDPISVIQFDATATPDLVAAPPATIVYDIDISNVGTGDAQADRVFVTLPPGFVYAAGSASVDGNGVADPAITADPAGDLLTFSNGMADVIAAGSTTLSLSADIPAGQASGAYTIAVETWYGGAFGRDINDARAGLAEVLVGTTRSEAPTVNGPILTGSTMVSGTSNEAEGTTITVYVNGIPVGTAMVDANGMWQTAVPPVFAGQNVTASAAAANKLDSPESGPPIVVSDTGGSVPCSDGIDNDGDGLIDFPDDPGCVDASDLDETDPPACSDGIDNDGDGNIDYPNDPKCSSFRDDDEGGMSECTDGVDNDGDGLTDDQDPDCATRNGRSETGLPACANGIDDDMDGDIDFPFDDGCENAVDDDETATPSMGMPDTGTGGPDTGMGEPDAGGGADTGPGRVDPGGVDSPPSSGAADEGCCSTVEQRPGLNPLVIALLAVAGLFTSRRR